MENTKGAAFNLEPGCTTCRSSSQGNPATNDWIPSAADAVRAKMLAF